MTYSLCQGHTNNSVESTHTLVCVHTTQNCVCDEWQELHTYICVIGTHQFIQCILSNYWIVRCDKFFTNIHNGHKLIYYNVNKINVLCIKSCA